MVGAKDCEPRFVTGHPAVMAGEALVISDAEKIVWLWPIRISEQAKVTGGTTKLLQLRISTCR